MNKLKFKVIFIIAVLLPLLTGCSDLVEVQDREFVLAMGVSYEDGLFDVVFAGPDYGRDTKEAGSDEGKSIHSYKSGYIGGIEDKFNFTSDKRLDYRHLEVVILDESISGNADMLGEVVEYLKGRYEISRNVLLFYYAGNVKDVFAMEEVLGRSVGDYIKKLDGNGREKYGIKAVSVGNLISAFSMGQALMVPVLNAAEGEVSVEGAAVYYEGVVKKVLTKEEYTMALIARGEGRNYEVCAGGEAAVVIRDVSSRFTYEYGDGKVKVYVNVKAGVDRMGMDKDRGVTEEELALDVGEYLYDGIAGVVEGCLKEGLLDVLGLYDMAAINCRGAWIDYEGMREEFLRDVDIVVSVEA